MSVPLYEVGPEVGVYVFVVFEDGGDAGGREGTGHAAYAGASMIELGWRGVDDGFSVLVVGADVATVWGERCHGFGQGADCFFVCHLELKERH